LIENIKRCTQKYIPKWLAHEEWFPKYNEPLLLGQEDEASICAEKSVFAANAAPPPWASEESLMSYLNTMLLA
jgi:hypothetical protein